MNFLASSRYACTQYRYFQFLQTSRAPVASAVEICSCNIATKVVKEANGYLQVKPRSLNLFQSRQLAINGPNKSLDLKQFITTVDMRISAGFWEEYPNGLRYTVEYLDTGAKDKAPIALVMHGSPGSCLSLSKVISSLYRRGYRVISPSLPDHGRSRSSIRDYTLCYTQSPLENAAFLFTLLEYLAVDRVDVAVGFSFGCGPLLALADKLELLQSLVLCAPSVHIPNKAQRPYWLLQLLSRLYDQPLFRPLIDLILIVSYRILGIKATDRDNRAATLRWAANANYPMVSNHVLGILQRQCPVRLVIPSDDELVPDKTFDQYLELYNKPPEQTFSEQDYREQGISSSSSTVTVYRLADTTHYLFSRHPWTVDLVTDICCNITKTKS